MKHAILCIDDETDIVDALERLFRKKYEVLKATSGDEGLALLEHHQVATIISDQRMPNMTGVEFFKKSQKLQPEAVRILLTGFTDVESVISSINEGHIYRYVTKPWDSVDLTNAVDKAVERFSLREQLEQKNFELERALESLQSLDDAKNHFMILINHELKTPLTNLINYLEILTETELSVEQKKYTDRLKQSASRLQTLTQDSLELVSAEVGLLKTHLKKTSADKICEGLQHQFAEILKTKKQTLLVEATDDNFKGDEKILRSVLIRLIDNAIKFSPNDCQIRVVGNNKEFKVINPGKAIPSKIIEKILKPFTLDENIMHHTTGNGLGLSISQALLKLHHSQLLFGSSKGHLEIGFLISDPDL